MRDYGKVHASFWTSETTRGLSDDGRMLALYLLTSPHSTIAGVFRLPDGYVCDDLQWGPERVREGFAELFANGFANRCETTKWVWIARHLKWNPPDNPNQRKAAAKVALSIPDGCAWKADFMRVCGESLDIDPSDFGNPSGTVPKPLANQKQEQEQEQEQERTGGKPPRPATASRTYAGWLASLPDDEPPLPDDDPVFGYAERVGLPVEFLELAWAWFEATYGPGGSRAAKRYRDWRQVFRNAVEGNWAKAWYADGDGYRLTTVGLQLQRSQRGAA